MTSDPADLRRRAWTAALAAGVFLRAERPAQLAVESKTSVTDSVTAMDRGSEELLVARLLAAGPDDAVLGEEGGDRAGSSGVRWIIDPLDGTVNYLYRLPIWSVSVAAEVDGEVVAAVVVAPELDCGWHAVRGGGAWRVDRVSDADDHQGPSGERIAVGTQTQCAQALIGTGFGYRAEDRRWQGRRVAGLIDRVRDIRRPGSAAIDMCWVADGRTDGYFESGTHLWDRAAAGLIVAEAGGVTCGADGGPPTDNLTVAGNPALAAALRELLSEFPMP